MTVLLSRKLDSVCLDEAFSVEEAELHPDELIQVCTWIAARWLMDNVLSLDYLMCFL